MLEATPISFEQELASAEQAVEEYLQQQHNNPQQFPSQFSSNDFIQSQYPTYMYTRVLSDAGLQNSQQNFIEFQPNQQYEEDNQEDNDHQHTGESEERERRPSCVDNDCCEPGKQSAVSDLLQF